MDKQGEWLRVVDAARLLGEGPATIRRRGRQRLLRVRQRHGGRALEVEAAGVWKMREERLAVLGLTSDPLRPDAKVGDPMALVARLAEVEADRAQLAARVGILEAETARLREALSLTMAADEVSDDRARTWKSVARALAGTDDVPGRAWQGRAVVAAPHSRPDCDKMGEFCGLSENVVSRWDHARGQQRDR